MPAGLRIFNDNGISQISDSHRNMVLIAKGTVGPDNPNNNPLDPIVFGAEVEVTSSTPVFFAASAPGGATAHLVSIEGNTYKGSVLYGVKGTPATWYAFSYPKPPTTNLGLQVFNESGSLMYDAAQKPLRLIYNSMITIPPLPPSPWTSSQAEFAPSTPPADVFIPQTRKNRTYASMGVHMASYLKLEKVYYKQTILGFGYFYYMPVQDANGIRLKARWSHFNRVGYAVAPFAESLGVGSLSYALGKQVSWIIDVTGY